MESLRLFLLLQPRAVALKGREARHSFFAVRSEKGQRKGSKGKKELPKSASQGFGCSSTSQCSLTHTHTF
eukprot:c41547_g1_i1 orf=1-207(-)